MRIAIAVHGRFEAFDLARELVRRGHDVGLLTNYPSWAAASFGIPRGCVRSFWPHGLLSRSVARVSPLLWRRWEAALHLLFGRWAAAVLRKQSWDVVSVFSGVAEETLRARSISGLHMLVRASAHIRTQHALLYEEELRTGAPQERPSSWMVAREEREYQLADVIRVLSRFAERTFLEQGVPAHKVRVVASGVQTDAFRPGPGQLSQRRERLLAGAPLRVLNVGTFSFRKGVWDTAHVIRALPPERFEFRFVGPVAAEANRLAEQLRGRATFRAKQPQARLPDEYAWGDVFLLPTIEDGYPAVLAQAAAAGLPILTTPNGAGWDVVKEGENGWVLPIRSPERLADQLRWADTHRQQLVDMVHASQALLHVGDAADAAADFEHVCTELIGSGAALR
jgi:glycosyltransferase involved in cell wall biosynthesis